MRALLIAPLLWLGTACSAETPPAPVQIAAGEVETIKPIKVAEVQQHAPITPAPLPFSCGGIPLPGGLLICRTEPNAKVKISRGGDDFYFEQADADGVIFIGLDRDETYVELQARTANRASAPYIHTPVKRDYDISRIDGLPKNMVSEYTEEELRRIRAATARKKVGFASRAVPRGFENGFIMPLEGIKTTNFGAQRILNGEPKRPHFGVDIAAPKGTPIVAPADGIVAMADEDMYFEGSLLLIDHGQGLISYYLHMEDIVVEAGETVKQGQTIATVGSKGRSTGPHLCWRLKWRNRNLDPELLTKWPADAR